MGRKPSYEQLEQRVKELEAFEDKCEKKVVAVERLFDHSLDMLCVADMNSYFKHINKAFETTPRNWIDIMRLLPLRPKRITLLLLLPTIQSRN